MPVVWSDRCLLHEPRGAVWIGVPDEADELPDRALAIRAALDGATFVDATAHDDDAVLAVHDGALVDFLRTAHDEWLAAGYPDDPGQSSVVSYIYPHPALVAGVDAIEPASRAARTGYHCFDTMTPIGPGTWEAARAAADVALTAVDLVRDGAPVAYACTRPPGHHVTRAAYGGSCYLNNAAIAAQRLRDTGVGRVAIVDIDAHHGNGAQTIFWERADVRTTSVHVDPAAGWFPHFLGLAPEAGAGVGDGANLNLPLAPGTGDDGWLDAVAEAVWFARDADALVVALGVDAAAGDPNSPLQVSDEGYRRAGVVLGQLELPIVVVQEGGYDLPSLGRLVHAALDGIEQGIGMR